MKRYKKADILQAVDILLEANDIISRVNRAMLAEKVIDVLILCQESAILLGTYFENADGDCSILVKILEKYCETVYQISTSLSDDNLCKKNAKKIQKDLSQFSNYVRYDLPEDKKEVVFLPYKASMWDSLESIWKAADADESIDAYVIPIPYYDKNPDGSFQEMYYEGSMYPDYVPVTYYADYDFSERQPDIIFIHNPYDECNYVTSVDPLFYTKNLKQYTKQLVYVPYFILNEVEPKDQAAIRSIVNFCMCPAVFYADKIFVQSENMRLVYIKILTEMAENRAGKKYWEEKILGIGSPKVDRILNACREDLELPEEWLKVIQKSDGRRKKIFIYNTSVSALLQHSKQMIIKIQDVLRIFKENQDRIALIWRPHPLFKATIKSMRPELYELYQSLVIQYKEEGWGIYDDSVDIDRAVAVSDAYYGDESSVVQLCKYAGKPVMIQDATQNSEKAPLVDQWLARKGFAAVEKIQNRFYFPQIIGNGLISYDLDTNRFKQEVRFAEEPEVEMNLFKTVISVDDRWLYLIPRKANAIYEYDIQTGCIESFGLEGVDQRKRIGYKFSDAVLLDDKIVLIPMVYSRMVIFDIRKHRVEYRDECLEFLHRHKITQVPQRMIWGQQACIFDGDIYMLVAGSDYIQKYDIKARKSELVKINMPEIRFSHLCSGGKYIWIIAEKAEYILKWDPANASKKVIMDFPKGFCCGKSCNFHKIIDGGRYVWCFPCQANMVLRIDKENDVVMDTINLSEKLLLNFEIDEYYYFAEQKGKYIYAMKADNGKIQIIDVESLEVKEIQLDYFHTFIKDDRRRLVQYWVGVQCTEAISLQEYINIIGDDLEEEYFQETRLLNQKVSCGEEILRYILK